MKKPIVKVVYLIILALFIFLTVKGLIQGKGAPKEVAEKVVEVENAKLLEENEGKLVLISGKMETDSILEFKDQGVKVNSPILKREVEMYQYLRDDNNPDMIIRRWSSDIPEKLLRDVKDNMVYENPTQELESDEVYGDVKVGEFVIGSDAIKLIPVNEVVKEFDPMPAGYRVDNDTFLTNEVKDNTKVGDYRMEFKYLDLEKTDEYTFIGMQKEGKLEEYKLDTGKNILQNFKGNLNKDAVVKEITSSENTSLYTSLVLLGITLVIGIFVFKPEKKII